MAKQKGPIHFSGSIGDITFVKGARGEKDHAKKRSSLSKHRVLTDPAFKNSRNAGRAFRTAAQNAGLIRRSFLEIVGNVSDRRLAGRLTAVLQKAILADKVSKPGKRKLLDDHLHCLKGFEFNKDCSLGTLLPVSYAGSVDRYSSKAFLGIPAFSTGSIKKFPAATHFRIAAAAAALNFKKKTARTDMQYSEWVSLKVRSMSAVQLEFDIKAGKKRPVFLVVAIEFCQMINGSASPLYDYAHNGASIVAVEVASKPS